MSRRAERITEQFHRTNERIRDGLQLPQDVCPGVPRVILTGSREAWIENYRGLLEVTDTCIRVQCRGGCIRLEGSRLAIDYYSDEDMKITGKICGVQFL